MLQQKQLEAAILQSEDIFIEKCHAEIYSHYTTKTKFIKFQNPVFKDRVWATLISPFSTTLSRVFPALLQLADSPNKQVANYTAAIIGRITEGLPDMEYHFTKGKPKLYSFKKAVQKKYYKSV